jgi:hypothetical protein
MHFLQQGRHAEKHETQDSLRANFLNENLKIVIFINVQIKEVGGKKQCDT